MTGQKIREIALQDKDGKDVDFDVVDDMLRTFVSSLRSGEDNDIRNVVFPLASQLFQRNHDLFAPDRPLTPQILADSTIFIAMGITCREWLDQLELVPVSKERDLSEEEIGSLCHDIIQIGLDQMKAMETNVREGLASYFELDPKELEDVELEELASFLVKKVGERDGQS